MKGDILANGAALTLLQDMLMARTACCYMTMTSFTTHDTDHGHGSLKWRRCYLLGYRFSLALRAIALGCLSRQCMYEDMGVSR